MRSSETKPHAISRSRSRCSRSRRSARPVAELSAGRDATRLPQQHERQRPDDAVERRSGSRSDDDDEDEGGYAIVAHASESEERARSRPRRRRARSRSAGSPRRQSCCGRAPRSCSRARRPWAGRRTRTREPVRRRERVQPDHERGRNEREHERRAEERVAVGREQPAAPRRTRTARAGGCSCTATRAVTRPPRSRR